MMDEADEMDLWEEERKIMNKNNCIAMIGTQQAEEKITLRGRVEGLLHSFFQICSDEDLICPDQ